MLKRKSAILASVLAAVTLIGAGAAFGTPGNSSSSSTSTTSTTAALPASSGAEAFAYQVGDAGTVTVESDGSGLAITAVSATDGWASEVEVAQGREVEADFRSGERRIQFNAELEDGQIRVRVRERVGDERTEDVTFTGLSTSSNTPMTTPASESAVESATTTAYAAGEAGTITISRDSNGLTVVSVDPADGWSTEVEVGTGREVEVDFRNGMRRVQFNAELEDGEVKVRVRDRMDDDTSNSGGDLDDDHTDNNGGDDDDHDRNDDNSGSGNAGDDENDDD